ncbi:MAG: copper-binding protein [Acidobacteriota bacterium]
MPRSDAASPLPRPPYVQRTLGAAALALGLLAAGCEAPAPEDIPATAYETRGIIRQLPSGAPGSELFIHHEPIPDFVSMEGEVVGMGAMTMSFPVADATELEALAVGDRVSFSLIVDWDGSPPIAIGDFTVLPDGTALSFEGEDGGQGGGESGDAHAGHGGDHGDHAGHGGAEHGHAADPARGRAGHADHGTDPEPDGADQGAPSNDSNAG